MDVDSAAREPGEGGAAQQRSGFERALEGLQATGASLTIRELVELLAKHGSEEGRMLAEYERVSASATDPATRYLIDLILDDERRHHRMLVELATAMAWETLGNAESPVPSLGWAPAEELATATRTLRHYEEADRRELQALRKKLRQFEETTLWGLIVQIMILDTEKHATILSFLERHARRGLSG
jgi:rubrerythrin